MQIPMLDEGRCRMVGGYCMRNRTETRPCRIRLCLLDRRTFIRLGLALSGAALPDTFVVASEAEVEEGGGGECW
jgi:hypothetical protein